ncbi:hypothetical protein [Pseudomonas sp. LRF_L74]|uniref:hypothetical protein n=1 Tax=Pseudomonas sp. LRF_L74 TaxID=3369422 RepID=UPI003F6209D3
MHPAALPRQAVLDHHDAVDCTVYRPDAHDEDAEELDLGDAKVLFTGPFQAPQAWDAAEREAFFDGLDPALFFTALIEPEAAPASKAHFVAQAGDYLAAIEGGAVTMYFVHERDEKGYVLIRDDQPLF